MKNIEYDSAMPLARLEDGDRAIIRVTHFNPVIVKEKDRVKYENIPNGIYRATCIGPYHLECKEYPILSGKYCFWRGNKWGCTEGIYADEMENEKK